MTRITKISRGIGAFCCLIAVALWFIVGTMMNVSADSGSGSLTLWCVKDDDKVVGMHWQIYRVGHRVADDYVFEGDFAGYRPTLGDKTKPMLEWDAETVANAGETLKVFTIVDNIPAIDDGYTATNGAVTFSGLDDGLYLVWGDILKKGDTTYIPSAIFFEMNGEDAAVLNAYPKIVLKTLNEGSANYSVKKVWQNDEDQPWNRSVSITVERYCDNKYYDTVQLSEANDWKFEWEDSNDHTWLVYEKEIPPNYTVAYKDNHTQYLIINTYETPTDDSSMTDIQTTKVTDDQMTDINTTKSSDDNSTATNTTATTDDNFTTQNTTPSGDAKNSTDIHTTTDNSSNHTTNQSSNASDRSSSNSTKQTNTTTKTTSVTSTPQEKAPQTGQLWWPVPALSIGGLGLLGLGISLTRKKDGDE